MKQQSTRERMLDNLESRIKEIKEANGNEEKREEFEQGILAVSKKLHYKIELSWGGPADWLEVITDEDNKEIEDIIYHFADWNTHEEEYLNNEEFKETRQFIEPFIIN